jgi:hypothetical protein
MEELTDVVRSTEMKQRQNGQQRQVRWRNVRMPFPARVARRKGRPRWHTWPAVRRQCGREVAGGHAAIAHAHHQCPGGRLSGAGY